MTTQLPPDLQEDLVQEAKERGINADDYTQALTEHFMKTLGETFAANQEMDQYRVLLIMSQIEQEFPRQWREASDADKFKIGLILVGVWFLTNPQIVSGIMEGVRKALSKPVRSVRLDYTAAELMKMPPEERDAILRAQAEALAPLYEADLALPVEDRELTAFTALNSDSFLEPEEYLSAAK